MGSDPNYTPNYEEPGNARSAASNRPRGSRPGEFSGRFGGQDALSAILAPKSSAQLTRKQKT